MKTSKRCILFTLFAASVAFSFGVPAALAQHSHSHGEVKPAASFGAAMKEIGERMSALDGLLAKGDLDGAHDEGDAIGVLAKSLGALALKADSGVPKAQVKEINKAGKALAEVSEGVHNAYEKKDLAAAKAAYAEMKKHFDALTALSPATAAKYSVDMKPQGGTIAVGKPTTFVFTIKDPTGLPVKKVERVHEKLLHLLIVSKDLSWYAHEHPEMQPDGTFTFTYTFPQAGEFFFFHDFTPPSVGQQVVTVPVMVAGTAPAEKPLVIDADKPKTIDGYTVTLDAGGPIKSGGTTHMEYTLTKEGKPVTSLQPYLGAMGHLVIISEDRAQFVHAHPHVHGDDGHSHADGGPKVDFEAHFTAPGTYKGWAQFNVGTKEKAQVITVPFTFAVAKGEGKGQHGHHDHK